MLHAEDSERRVAKSSARNVLLVGPETMTKSELASRLADRAHLTGRQSEAIVDIVLACITEALTAGDKVELRGFGSFRTRSRDARKGCNPRTGETIQVPPRRRRSSGPRRRSERNWSRRRTGEKVEQRQGEVRGLARNKPVRSEHVMSPIFDAAPGGV